LRHRLTRLVPYSAVDIFELVGDVEAYPKFVRWITELRAWDRRPGGEGIEVVDAEATVRFGPIRERFSTRVTLDRPRLAIDVALISGPFRRLENRWRFTPAAQGSELSFDIDFQMRSRLLERLLDANIELAAGRLIRCFEDRAAELYGGRSCKRPTGS